MISYVARVMTKNSLYDVPDQKFEQAHFFRYPVLYPRTYSKETGFDREESFYIANYGRHVKIYERHGLWLTHRHDFPDSHLFT